MGPSPGQHVGPYEVVDRLGAGGMGEVYRARDTRLQRNVALKILPEAVARDDDRLARFSREAEPLPDGHLLIAPHRRAGGTTAFEIFDGSKRRVWLLASFLRGRRPASIRR